MTQYQKDSLLPVRDVAKLLFVHPNTLRRWADKGIIESYRITSRGDRRFKFDDVVRLISKLNEFNQK